MVKAELEDGRGGDDGRDERWPEFVEEGAVW